jgi:hypothetical protein
MLIKVRNDLVHYKMQFEVPSYVKHLQQRGVALDIPNSSWVDNLSTSEGIRWAHNTVCEIIRALGKLATSTSHPALISMANHDFFSPIPESAVKDRFSDKGVTLNVST